MVVWLILTGSIHAVSELDKQDFADKLRIASAADLRSGLFRGSLTIEKRGLSNEEIQRRADAYFEKLTRDRNAGILPLTKAQLEAYEKESGLSENELRQDPIFNQIVDRLIKNMATAYRNSLFHTQSNLYEKRQVSYWVAPDFRARKESTLEVQSFNGAVQIDKAGIFNVTAVNSENTKILSPQDKTGQILKGSRERIDYYLDLGMDGFMLTKAGRSRAGYTAENIAALEEAVVNNQRIYRVIITVHIGPGMSVTYMNEYFPEYGYCLKSSYVFENNQLVSGILYDQYRQIEPGLWYPMSQAEEKYERKAIPSDIQERLAQKNISYQELASCLAEAVVVQRKRLLLETVQREISIPDSLFDLQFPLGTSVLDFTVPPGPNGTVLNYTTGFNTEEQMAAESALSTFEEPRPDKAPLETPDVSQKTFRQAESEAAFDSSESSRISESRLLERKPWLGLGIGILVLFLSAAGLLLFFGQRKR